MKTTRPSFRPARAAFVALLALFAVARASAAQTPVFLEDWESGPARWRAQDANPLEITTEPLVCSTHFQRETVPSGYGRVFTRAAIPVTGGRRYCLAAWIRGSAGTQPFLGINLTDAAGTLGTEHWLIAADPHYTNNYGGTVVPVPSDGAWHYATAMFTLEPGARFAVIKDELFVSGAPGTADFDDVALYAGRCPAPPAGPSHAVCVAPTALCTAAGRCTPCTEKDPCINMLPPPAVNYAAGGCRAGAGDAECAGGALHACEPSGACGQCSATNATACTGATPVCNAALGVCVGCVTNAQCAGATPVCDRVAHACR